MYLVCYLVYLDLFLMCTCWNRALHSFQIQYTMSRKEKVTPNDYHSIEATGDLGVEPHTFLYR